MAKKILIIEDDSALRELLSEKLRGSGYDVDVAEDGEKGMSSMQENIPDLVLLDILMPIKNGMEVLEDMKKDDKLTEVPVIIISNSGQPVEIDRALELGVKDFLIKATFDPYEVLEKVKNVLG